MMADRDLADLRARLTAARVRGLPVDVLERGSPKELRLMVQVVGPLLSPCSELAVS
jgi:hypothetical protein